jgi:drug/metabolite transporter (DMT)-like permease
VLLRERISFSRFFGAVVIVVGLAVIGGESIGHIGHSGVQGDLIFVLTGFMFAGFATLVRYWRVSAFSAAAAINVVSRPVSARGLVWRLLSRSPSRRKVRAWLRPNYSFDLSPEGSTGRPKAA